MEKWLSMMWQSLVSSYSDYVNNLLFIMSRALRKAKPFPTVNTGTPTPWCYESQAILWEVHCRANWWRNNVRVWWWCTGEEPWCYQEASSKQTDESDIWPTFGREYIFRGEDPYVQLVPWRDMFILPWRDMLRLSQLSALHYSWIHYENPITT